MALNFHPPSPSCAHVLLHVFPVVATLLLKVLNGQSWVLVDGAILDVSSFSQRHPGGARLIVNAVGTDVTQELLGEDLSVGHAMSFTPHTHPEARTGR